MTAGADQRDVGGAVGAAQAPVSDVVVVHRAGGVSADPAAATVAEIDQPIGGGASGRLAGASEACSFGGANAHMTECRQFTGGGLSPIYLTEAEA